MNLSLYILYPVRPSLKNAKCSALDLQPSGRVYEFIGWRRRDLEDLYTDERKDDGKMASKLTHSPEYWRTSGCNDSQVMETSYKFTKKSQKKRSLVASACPLSTRPFIHPIVYSF
jgi:hypothetical protein